jgi:hypothetical protein
MLERINESNWNVFIGDAAATQAANRDSVPADWNGRLKPVFWFV